MEFVFGVARYDGERLERFHVINFDSISNIYSLCCKCGISMPSNQTNMCAACFTSECDITADIPKQHTVIFCPKCDR